MEWKTWAEFKQAVEAAGVKDDDTIFWIDASPANDLRADYTPETGVIRGGWEIY